MASPLRGALWENLVFGQIWRWAEMHNWRRHVFFWRDKSGHEVDFLVDMGDQILLVEAKAAEHPARPMPSLDHVEAQIHRTAPHIRMICKAVACQTSSLKRLKGITLWNPVLDSFDEIYGAD